MTVKFSLDVQNNDAFTDITSSVEDAFWSLGMTEPGQMVADTMICTLRLDNTSGNFTPENASGAYYPHLKKPNRRFKIEDVTAGGTITLWRGWLGFFKPKWTALNSSNYATVRGYGPKHFLQELEVVLPYMTNTTVDAIIKKTLVLSQLPSLMTTAWLLGIEGSSELGVTTVLRSESSFFDLSTGDITISEYGDFTPESAWEIIKDVVAAESGRFFFARDGRATFWNREYLALQQTAGGTINASQNTPLLESESYDYGKLVKNVIRVTARPRQTGESQTLWELDSYLSVAAGDAETIEVDLRQSDGRWASSGIVTVDTVFTAGTATVTPVANGGVTTITIDNSANSVAAEIDPDSGGSMTVTGVPTVQQNQFDAVKISGSSVSDYLKQEMSLSTEALQTYAEIDTLAGWELGRWAQPNGAIYSLSWRFRADGTANAFLLNNTIGTRLNIDLDGISHDADHWLIGEEHTWTPGEDGGQHDAKLYFEPAANNDKWVLGVSKLGQNTVLA